ncbi:hypothetical protein AB0E96_16135 [Kitasatospora sp. NPDC036755]|uniref:hypothetical protein n=1 Tax=Kitasatospora sp. NPDC036755 TaxID=3154600 RepID=UPI0033D1346A
MERILRTRPGVKALAAAAVAAMTLVPLAASESLAAPAPATAPAAGQQAGAAVALAAGITPGQSYVLSPQNAPDQWLGENAWNSITTQASRWWYGQDQYHHALWTARDGGNGAIEFQNFDFGGSLQDDGGAVEANWGNGGSWDWVTVAGPSGTVALRNRATNRYLALAGNTAVMTAGAFYWFVVNAHP